MPENTKPELIVDQTTNGSVYYAPDVIATIAGIALTEVEGIANSVHFTGLIAEKFSKKPVNNIKNITRGIKVDVKEGIISVNISVTVEYGYSVPEVSRNIQESVKKTIETMTGMMVRTVDVHVSGLSFEKENKEAAELEYRNYMLSEKKAETAAPENAAQSESSEE